MKITIDSNLINLKKKDSELNKLEDYHQRGIIEIVGTERLLQEMTQYSPEAFEKAQKLSNVSEPFTVGYSAIGSAYISQNDPKLPSFKDLSRIIFPDKHIDQLSENESNDVMHLLAHVHSDSEVFVTNNTRDFVNRKKTNQNRNYDLNDGVRNDLNIFEIVIMTPNEVIIEIEKKYGC